MARDSDFSQVSSGTRCDSIARPVATEDRWMSVSNRKKKKKSQIRKLRKEASSRTKLSQPPTLPLQNLRKPQHALRPLVPRRVPPRRKRGPRSSHRAIDVRFAGDLDLVRDERVVDGAVDGQGVAGRGREVFAVDEEVGLEGWGRHGFFDLI